MEYGAYGSLSDICTRETEDLMDELFVEGCWVETRVSSKSNRSIMKAEIMFQEETEEIRWWIGPRTNPGPSSSVKERLVLAVGYLKKYVKKNCNVMIQVWVPSPARRGVDLHYNYEQDLRAFHFLEDWVHDSTPNVRFFTTHEYPPVHHAHAGSLTLPVFERGTHICLGYVQILMPNNPDLYNHLSHLQGVDFRSCSHHNFIPPAMTVKGFDELYESALNEIVQILTCVCKAHNLPLALTWAPCIQQGKSGCGHSNQENYVSSVDGASFVADLEVLGFQEACSEYHLLGGQGVVGTAFTTNKPCFANDIRAFTKAEYPLAHHANMFGFHAAVAIPLRSDSADFVLEFFLPRDCHHNQDLKQILNSLSMLVHQACRSLHLVMEREEEEEQEMESSWIAHMLEAQVQQKGKGVSVSLEYLQEPKQEFKVTTNCNQHLFSELEEEEEGTASVTVEPDGLEDSYTTAFNARRSSRKSGDKRRTKADKTISLPVLRQYFAGSLKDAAKSIGVCPTTLKRICRQHGITRWPSRKIKKVGHSLRKLQLVIDSVQGTEGAIQIGSFYNSFPELSSANGVSESSKISNNDSCEFYCENGLYNQGQVEGATSFKSPRSFCSQTCNRGPNQPTTIINNADIRISDNQPSLGASIQVQVDSKHFTHQYHPIQTLEPLPPLPQTSVWNTATFRVKATFGDEKIRFSFQKNWGFRDLQMEIARRFNLNEINNIQLKYLDDARELVLLTCDADLEECKDINRSSQSRTIRLFLFQPSPLNHANSFAGTSPS